MHSPKINVSFFAAGILVQLFYVGIKSGENELFDSEIILDELVSYLKILNIFNVSLIYDKIFD